MPNKDRLAQLVSGLSEYECSHLLPLVDRTASGSRFWESDMATVYNEYIKLRYSKMARSAPGAAPPVPMVEDGIFAPIPIIKSYSEAERVSLPPPAKISALFADTLLNRRSQRDYTGGPLSIQDFSTLVHYSCGVTGYVPAYGYERLPLRTFPSSGGLQAPEVYLSVQSVESVRPALYHYHAVDHAIELLKPGSHGGLLREVCLDQPWVETSSVVFVITGYYERLKWKYQARGYRFMCMDAGFLGQNIYLAAEAMSLGACAIAGFMDDAIEVLFGIDGEDEVPLLIVCVGMPKK